MRKNFIPFDLERQMSLWENQVEYNISESGVHPLSLAELIEDSDEMKTFLSTRISYPQTNGSLELRERIAAIYPGARSNQVLVTTGAAQANFTTLLTMMDPGEEAVVMFPNYMQIWGIAKNLGLTTKAFHLNEEENWSVDLDQLKKIVSNQTRLIAVCNPNNPTGHILSTDEMDAIVDVASRVGAWLLADEVYAGAERLTDEITPSFWGTYERVLAIGSLSKAYGLPGLRIGWVVAPGNLADEIWARQDYITISTTALGNKLAAHVLSPEVRPRLLARTRSYIRRGYHNLEHWLEQHADLFSYVPPQAAAIVFIRYHRKTNSSALVQRLIQEQSTYVVPGDHFGLDHHVRVSYGLQDEYLNEGLNRLYRVISSAD